ncbi:MAG TPA: hypothetical protein VGK50_06990 [Coriobacteriia bacterium]|jgi:hypothetical protein
MSGDRTRILGMLADGKITAAEAETLLDALESSAEVPAPVKAPSADWPSGPSEGGTPKFMYVKVTGEDKVDVKIPLALLRTGLKLTSLIPKQAMDQINESMSEAGMSIDFNNLKPEDVEDIIASLGEMEVNVEAKDGDHVRVFCA